MVRGSGETTAVDPLIDCTPFSLLPLSFNPCIINPLNSSLLNSDLSNRLKLMASKSPEKLLKQANRIMDDSLELGKSDSLSTTVAPDKNTDKSSSVKEVHIKQKRPAAMRKRATFCAKPILSQSDVVLESTIDIDKLEDPEEYFAACESMENARKEVDKQKPKALMELDQNLPVLSPRRRRPSIYGKPVTYKHHAYASIAAGDVGEKLLSSEETSQNRIPSVSRMDSLPETNVQNNTPQLRDSAVSSQVHHSEEAISMSGDDELEALEILRDMQFSFKDIGKISLDATYSNVQRPESGTTSQALPKITDSISLLKGLQDSVGSQSPVVFINRLRENSNRSQLSQGHSRSPLASISSLKRHISKLSPSEDPFTAHNIDPLSSRGSSPEKQHASQSDYENFNESARSVMPEEESARDQIPTSLGNETMEPVDEAIQLDHDAACKETHEKEPDCERPFSHGEENVAHTGEDPLGFTAPREFEEIEDQMTTVPDTVHLDSNILDSTFEDFNLKTVEECATGTGEALNLDDIVTEEPNKDTASDVPEGRESQAHTSKKTAKKGRKASALSNSPILEETQNKKRKVERGKGELKMLSRRKSLFDAGTKWDGGVRRSTRIRMRPLEYWKGERFLYGRVTDSLVTVIGVKYASPSKEVEQKAVKVKSFVSDSYKELVDLASFH